jgi:hypothetical protein
MKSTQKKIRWGALTPDELAEATKEFDRPLPASRYKPATRAQRARFARALRAGARGREIMASLVLDEKLASEAEAYAKKKKLTVIQLIERGLRRELAVKD